MGDALDEIQEVLDEAYRVLMDQTLRSAYVSRLPE
jgi:ubiquinone/menaquinone biosynthesis C-methylase UbiE